MEPGDTYGWQRIMDLCCVHSLYDAMHALWTMYKWIYTSQNSQLIN